MKEVEWVGWGGGGWSKVMEGVRMKHPKLSRLSQNQCIKYYKERSNTSALRFISGSCFCFISVPFGVNLLLTGALKIIQQK